MKYTFDYLNAVKQVAERTEQLYYQEHYDLIGKRFKTKGNIDVVIIDAFQQDDEWFFVYAILNAMRCIKSYTKVVDKFGRYCSLKDKKYVPEIDDGKLLGKRNQYDLVSFC